MTEIQRPLIGNNEENSLNEDLSETQQQIQEKEQQIKIDNQNMFQSFFSNEDPLIYNIPKESDVGQNVIRKLLLVSIVAFILMGAEITGGILANSLAILTDAAHMFSDFCGFFISIASIKIAKRPSTKTHSYGYHRAEIIGALVSVVLIWGLTLWLVVEAVDRLQNQDFEINQDFMLYTSIFGLISNLLMMKVLHGGHGHSHDGGHGHSHGGHGHSHGAHEDKKQFIKSLNKDIADSCDQKSHSATSHKHGKKSKDSHHHSHKSHNHDHGHSHSNNDHSHGKEDKHDIEQPELNEQKNEQTQGLVNSDQSNKDHNCENEHNPHSHNAESKVDANFNINRSVVVSLNISDQSNSQKKGQAKNLSIIADHDNPNMRAAMIHLIGDLIQSFGVLIAAIIIKFYPHLKIIDPVCTFVFSILVMFTTWNVVRDCIRVLMEATPVGINFDQFEQQMLAISDVKDIHDIHIWSLSHGKPAMSAHIFSTNPVKTLQRATALCRQYGIYHSTIQVEDWNHKELEGNIKCHQNIH